MSYVHRGGTTPLIHSPIGAFVERVAATHPDNEAVVSVEQGVRLTYAELIERVHEVARGLLALGIAKGGRVGIWSTDNVEWVLMQLATASIGAVLVNFNPASRPRELEHALIKARVQGLVLIPSFRSSEYVQMMRDLCPELEREGPLESAGLPDLQWVTVYDPARSSETNRPAPGFRTWQDLLAAGRDVSPEALALRAARLDADDPVNIQFTSGTTGSPKAVVLSHHSILNNALAVGEVMRFTPADRLCVPVPFYHCFGMVVSNLACLVRGATMTVSGKIQKFRAREQAEQWLLAGNPVPQ